jgi:hypothetical protein
MPPRNDSPSRPCLVTGSRRSDIALLLAFLALALAAAPWLRVYYRITAFELELTRIEAGGERTPVALPPQLDAAEHWNRKPDDALLRIERAFRQLAAAEPRTRLELTVRYSFNSPDLGQSVTWQAP